MLSIIVGDGIGTGSSAASLLNTIVLGHRSYNLPVFDDLLLNSTFVANLDGGEASVVRGGILRVPKTLDPGVYHKFGHFR